MKNANQPLVSILLAAYKTEQYIEQCLESVVNQTYCNLEIIVVNDGTPDNAGKIADRYADRDTRVSVIHKENGGLSSARNAGLDAANGEYVIFVDTDDWLALDFVEYMLGLINETGCDVVIARDHFTSLDMRQSDNDKITKITSDKFIASYLYPVSHEGVWNKMYLRKLIEDSGVRFRLASTTGEGMNFNTRLAQYVDEYGVGSRRVYYYRIDNQGSATSKPNVERQGIGAIENIDSIIDSLKNPSPYLRRALLWHRWHCHIYALTNIIGAGEKDKYKEFYDECRSYLRTNVMDALRGDVSIKWKFLDLLRAFFPVSVIGATVYFRKRFGRRK